MHGLCEGKEASAVELAAAVAWSRCVQWLGGALVHTTRVQAASVLQQPHYGPSCGKWRRRPTAAASKATAWWHDG